jgi:OmcA/MtrC family decaheme c-type cytochrome
LIWRKWPGEAAIYKGAAGVACDRGLLLESGLDLRGPESATEGRIKYSCKLWGSAAALVLVALVGCGGGGTAPTPVAPAGPPASVPAGTSPVVLTASTPPATFAALAPKITLGQVVISGPPVVNFALTDVDGNAIVGFGSTSQASTSPVASYPNISFALAKLVPGTNGSPSKWVSYIVSTVPTTTAGAVPTRPTSDNTGTLVDHQNGTYSYTFYRDVTQMSAFVAAATLSPPNVASDLGDLTYDPTLTHRLTIQISGAAPGTGTNTANGVQVVPAVSMTNPVNLIYDFIPATGQPVGAGDTQRVITDKASCDECHGTLGGIPGTESASFHGGSRKDSNLCDVCHTDQRKYGRTNVASAVNAANHDIEFPAGSSTYVADGVTVGNLPVLVHKLHLGKELVKQNYNFAGVLLNGIKYPQDIRNCTKCHDDSATAVRPTPQGDNWMNVPSRLACGACHDGINFATGTGVTLADAANGLTSSPFGHVGGARPDDSLCAVCHTPAGIAVSHIPVTVPDPQNALLVPTASGGNSNTGAAWIAGNTTNLPAGAIAVSYHIQSVSVDATTRRPSLVFQMLQNGVAVALNTRASGKAEIWDNFVGSPSAYFVFAVPQDGIAAPADFNASVSGYLRNIWNGTATGTGAGILTGPDANGYYTITLTGVTIPANGVMVTGGMGYSYAVTTTQPLTQTNLPAYPATPNALGLRAAPAGTGPLLLTGGLIVVAQDQSMVATGYSGRRPIIASGSCDNCHAQLGVFTSQTFHAAQRNDGATCSWCHNPARTSSGWSGDSASFIHALHAAGERTVPFTWHAVSLTDSFATIGYPGVLSNCATCHLPGTFDFSATASASALPNRLYRTVATGTFNGTVSASNSALAVYSLSPYVVADGVTNYGTGFSFNAATDVTTPASATTLVNSPIATVCFACHDSALDRSHIESEGGSIYDPRSVALAKGEQCMLCHAAGAIADINIVHPKQ